MTNHFQFTRFLLCLNTLLLGILASVIAIQTVEAIHNPAGFEDFEDFAPLTTPDSSVSSSTDWYTITTSGSGGSVQTSGLWGVDNSTRSIRYQSSASIFSAHMSLSPFKNFCDNLGQISFSVNRTAFPSPSPIYIGVSQNNSGTGRNPGFYVAISNDGAIYAVPDSQDSTTTLVLLMVADNNTQLDFVMKDFDCNTVTFTLQELNSESVVTASDNSGFPITSPVSQFDINANSIAETANLFIDNINLTNYYPVVPDDASLEATADPAPSGLIGWSVNPTGSTDVVIIREDNGANVTTYNGLTLTDIASANTPNCARFGGVTALSEEIAYLDCEAEAGIGTDDVIRIRSPSFATAASKPCSNDGCEDDIAIDSGPSNEIVQIGQVQGFRINWEGFRPAGTDDTTYAFTYTDETNGEVGVWAQMSINNGNNIEDFDSINYVAAGEVIEDMCSWRDTQNDVNYMAVASSSGLTKVWRVDISRSETLGVFVLTVDMTEVSILSAAWSQAVGIDCTGNFIAVATESGRVGVVSRDSSTEVFPSITGVTTGAQGVAISANGLWFAYWDGATNLIHVFNVTSGTETGSFSYVPSGLLQGIFLDAKGQSLYAFSTNDFKRYSVVNITTVSPEGIGESDVEFVGTTAPPTGGVTTEGQGLLGDGEPVSFGSDLDDVGSPFGISGAIVALVMGLMLTGGLAIWLGLKLGSVGALLGFGLGVVGSVILAWFPRWIILFMLALVVGAIIWSQSRGNGIGS